MVELSVYSMYAYKWLEEVLISLVVAFLTHYLPAAVRNHINVNHFKRSLDQFFDIDLTPGHFFLQTVCEGKRPGNEDCFFLHNTHLSDLIYSLTTILDINHVHFLHFKRDFIPQAELEEAFIY